jgi:hypothetical protein
MPNDRVLLEYEDYIGDLVSGSIQDPEKMGTTQSKQSGLAQYLAMIPDGIM